MRLSILQIFLVVASLSLLTVPSHAIPIVAPVAVINNTMGAALGSEAHLFDQSGLSTGYTSGVTDFNAYIGGNPTHALLDASNSWAGLPGPALGYIDFDLGAVSALQAVALWNQDNTNAIVNFEIWTSLLPTFSVPSIWNFTASAPSPITPQTFLTPSTTRYVRLRVLSIAGGNNVNLGEIAFGVPEPSTALLLACGLAGLASAGRRRSLH